MFSNIVTLFIQDTEISLLVLRGKEISKWARLALEPGLVNQGVVLDQAALSGQVKELYKIAKVQAQKTVVGLSGINTLYRLISLPRLPENLIDDAVRNAARRILPIPLEEVYLSYQIVPSSEEEIRVFMAAVPQKAIDTVLPTLRDAGVNPFILDLAPLALCQTLNIPSAIIIDSRASYLSILVVIDSLPQMIRTQSTPTDIESSSARMATITDELDRTIAFYNSEHLEKPLDAAIPIFVCGDLAQSPESWQSLGDNLSSRVTKLSSPLAVPDGFVTDDYIVNIGLALKELSLEKGKAGPRPVDLNVIPESYRPQHPSIQRIVIPIAVTIAMLLIIILTLRLYNTIDRNNSLASQLATFESRVSEQQSEPTRLREAIDNLTTQIEPIQGKTDLLNTLSGDLEHGRSEIDRDLVVIAGQMQSVDLRSISHQGNSVNLNGSANDEDQIFKYARALRNSGRFSIVLIASIGQTIVEDEARAPELHIVQVAMTAMMAEAEIDEIDREKDWTNNLAGLPTADGAITVDGEIISFDDYLITTDTKYFYQWEADGTVLQDEEVEEGETKKLTFAMVLNKKR